MASLEPPTTMTVVVGNGLGPLNFRRSTFFISTFDYFSLSLRIHFHRSHDANSQLNN